MRSNRPSPSIADLIDLERLARQAEAEGWDSVVERHSGAGPAAGEPGALLLNWLAAAREQDPRLPGRQFARRIRVAGAILAVLGLFLGAGAAAGVFAYTGARPVNVVHVLGVFVGLQALLLLLWLIAALPGRWLAMIPGFAGIQDALRHLSPGCWASALARRVGPRLHDSLTEAGGQFRAIDQKHGRVWFWMLSGMSQRFAAAFNIGAVLAAVGLVVFTDLAFAWSTTLRIEASSLHRLTLLLSAPWQSVIPQAAPSLELVEATRYFRHGAAFVQPASGAGAPDVALLGAWWPFLLTCMVVYGLAPRLLTAAVSAWRLCSALRSAPLNTVDCQALLDRIERRNARSSPERAADATAPGDGVSSATFDLRDTNWVAIAWAMETAPSDQIARQLAELFGRPPAAALSAGGADLRVDQRTLDSLTGDGKTTAVVALVKAWEPPTRDFSTFIAAVRERIGREARILALPVELAPDGRLAPPTRIDLEHWRMKLRELGDPWLGVAGLGEGTIR